MFKKLTLTILFSILISIGVFNLCPSASTSASPVFATSSGSQGKQTTSMITKKSSDLWTWSSKVLSAQMTRRVKSAAILSTTTTLAPEEPTTESTSPSNTTPTNATAVVPVTSPPTTVTTVPPASPPSGSTYDEWTRVAVCEEGGWGHYGFPNYPDSLGINAVNWYGNGGGSDLSPAAQIAVAERVVARYASPGYVPDQNGCASW